MSVLQSSRLKFRQGLRVLCTTRPAADPQVAEALADLGWTSDGPIFGHPSALASAVAPAAAAAAAAEEPAVHCLQSGIPFSEFVLTPEKVGGAPCSFDFTTPGTPGFEFHQFLCKF